MAAYISKRYTILVTMLCFLAVCIWHIYITDFETFKVARIIGGLALGVVAALGPPIIGECFPKHQLGSAMAIYSMSLGAGAAIGPVIGGLVFHWTGDWPWFFKFSAIIVAINLIGSILMLPETSYEHRNDAEVSNNDLSDKIEISNVENVHNAGVSPDTSAAFQLEQVNDIYKKRSFYIEIPCRLADRNPVRLFLQPLVLLLAPAVVIASLLFGVTVSYTININIIFSQYFEGPPNLWSPLSFGLLNICTLFGLVAGIPLGGALPDFLYRRSARRNGIPKLESRLPAFLPGCIISPFGTFLVGLGLKNNYHWTVLALGWLLLMTGLTSNANILLTYCVDCYPWKAIHIGVVMNTIKNSVAFALSYIALPWYQSSGPLSMFGVMAGILFALNLFTIPLYFFGPRVRETSLKYVG